MLVFRFHRRQLPVQLLSTLCLLVCARETCLADEFSLDIFPSGKSASLRSIVVEADGTVWAGGSEATLLKSSDGGASWQSVPVDVPLSCDFRDLEQTPAGILLMSAGKGDDSRVLLARENQLPFQLVLANPDKDGFFNGVAVTQQGWGALLGDPVDGKLSVFVTSDGGRKWQRIPGPLVHSGEYGFAASGTGVVVDAERGIGLVTGGSRCCFYRSTFPAGTWTTTVLGMRHGNESSGAFSVAQSGGRMVAVGGDYRQPERAQQNVAFSRDRGKTWNVPQVTMPHKACVLALDAEKFLACGRTGIAFSSDGGASWKTVSQESFYTMTLARSTETKNDATQVIWLAGAKGRIARLKVKAPVPQ